MQAKCSLTGGACRRPQEKAEAGLAAGEAGGRLQATLAHLHAMGSALAAARAFSAADCCGAARAAALAAVRLGGQVLDPLRQRLMLMVVLIDKVLAPTGPEKEPPGGLSQIGMGPSAFSLIPAQL